MVFRQSRLLQWNVVPCVLLNSLELSSSYTGRSYTKKILRLVHTVHLCVLYGSETSVDHFPVHLWLVFVTYTACLLCGATWIFTYISGLFSFLKRPVHGSGGESLAFHRGGPDSMPSQSLCYLWLTKWYWGRVFSECFVLLLSLSLHQCSILIFICMLHYQEKLVKSGNLPQKQWSFGNRGALDRKLTFLILRRNVRHVIKNAYWSACKVPVNVAFVPSLKGVLRGFAQCNVISYI